MKDKPKEKQKEKSQEIYLRYLDFLNAMESSPDNILLDFGELQLLNAIALKIHHGESLKIGDVTLMRDLASPATLHSRLKSLKEKKLISFMLGDDDRSRYVMPSDLAYKYFDQVGKLIAKATNH